MVAAVGVVVLISILIGEFGWSMISREHQEAADVPIEVIDFQKLKDGTYMGRYAGGMYRWRANTIEVTVLSGRVTEIVMLNTVDPGMENADPDVMFERVKAAQSLQVDTVSGATLTTRGYLKGIECALVQALK